MNFPPLVLALAFPSPIGWEIMHDFSSSFGLFYMDRASFPLVWVFFFFRVPRRRSPFASSGRI